MDNESNMVNESSTPVETTASNPVSTPSQASERMFRQSEVNELAGKIRHEAVESYKKQQASQSNQANTATPYTQGSPLNESDFRRIAAEEAQRVRDQSIAESQNRYETESAQKIVDSFWNKISPGKEKYDDFDKVTGNIEYAKFPNTVQLLAEYVDNSHDVLYELGKNRLKLGQLEQLSYMSPKDAIHEVQRLAASIKDNETASKLRQPNAPLSQQRPSHVGTDSGGALSMADLKRKYRG